MRPPAIVLMMKDIHFCDRPKAEFPPVSRKRSNTACLIRFVLLCVIGSVASPYAMAQETKRGFLKWTALPDLPDELGVAGPFVGVHNDALIVAGGANFPVAEGEDLWEVPKVWHDDAWVLIRKSKDAYEWRSGFKLPVPVAYGVCVSTPDGIVCAGGSNGDSISDNCFLLQWDAANEQLVHRPLPSLPTPCAHGAATMIGDTIYVAGGQQGPGLETAMSNLWRLDWSRYGGDSAPGADDPALAWEKLPAWPGPERAFNITIAQHNGFDDCIYIISGRRQKAGTSGVEGIECLTDVYEFNPQRFDPRTDPPGSSRDTDGAPSPWRSRTDIPKCVMAGTAASVGQAHVFVLGGADGSLLSKTEELRDRHPGFPKQAWAYHTITDTWTDAGATPANHVTTPAVEWDGQIMLASGEVRPRVRTTQVWRIEPLPGERRFGAVNFSVLIVYLLGMVGVGVYFARRNKNTDDFFRGGQRIAWWAAGCSIFATMLSSITYMAIPAKAFAQDLVYLVGNFMIPAVSPLVVFLALPFFRQIDATSAYEYLEKRFNRPVRLFASALFTLFHIFRMGIVMSLAALALAAVTPLSAETCIVVMGVLSVVYCTLGGVEAVVWTDTMQTVVLLGGAAVCSCLMVAGADGGLGTLLQDASSQGKLHLFNLHWDPTSMSLALWVIVVGAIGQNLSSYTSDQAVVQRYMTTPDIKRAANSIWTAAFLAVPASFLFFFMGTALWGFYRANPDRLDPTITTDQILPLFISRETPIGFAGLIVAGIFAAAQSTISTSMNSTATAVVTDFMRPFNLLKTERGYLNWARLLTFALGIMGTLLGLLFVHPDIKSLFDEFIKVVGLFMGVLGGLFGLGMLTRRTNGLGAFVGAVGGVVLLLLVERWTDITGYLYAAIGIAVCMVIGYGTSILFPRQVRDLDGLTVYTRHRKVVT